MRTVLLLLLVVWLSVSPDGGVAVHAATTETASHTPSADLPYKRDDPITAGLILRVVASLAVALLLAFGIVYALKHYLPGWRFGPKEGGSKISVLEIRRIAPKTVLFLVVVDGKKLLLAQSPERVTAVDLAESAPLASDPSMEREHSS